MAQSKHTCTPPLPAHRCTDHDCIYLGQPSGKSCACHKTREQMLVEQNAELLAALKEARDALNGAPNTIGLHSQIDSAIAKAEGGAS